MANSELQGLLDELWAEYVEGASPGNRSYGERLSLYTHVADRVAALVAADAQALVDSKDRQLLIDRVERLRAAMGLDDIAGPHVEVATVGGWSLSFGPGDITGVEDCVRPSGEGVGNLAVKTVEFYRDGFGLQLVAANPGTNLKRDELSVVDDAGFRFALVGLSQLRLPTAWHAMALFRPRVRGHQQLTIAAGGEQITVAFTQ